MRRPLDSNVSLRWMLCLAAFSVLMIDSAVGDDWPQWRGPGRDAVWHETGIIDAFPAPQLEHVWSAEIANGYSGPTVSAGRVYVSDRIVETVSLERVLCFDASKGTRVWVHEYESEYRVSYPDGPRASVTVNDGRVYVLGTMGHSRCLDAASGKLLWKKDPGTDYKIRPPVWGMCAAPLVEGTLVIAQIGAEPDACIVAWDKVTGEERWRALEDNPSYSAPIVIEQAGKRVLVCWTDNHIVGLNPATGELYWKSEVSLDKPGMNIATPVVEGDRLFLTAFYDGSYMFKLSEDSLSVEKIWRRIGKNEKNTDALYSVHSTPLMIDGYVYGVDSFGELRCLDATNGDRIWEDLSVIPKSRWGTIHMVRNGERTWLFTEEGELIIAALSPEGFRELSRAKLIEPTAGQYSGTWSSVINESTNTAQTSALKNSSKRGALHGPIRPMPTNRSSSGMTGIWSV
jgi:outer membrane protein assembly factor BamB